MPLRDAIRNASVGTTAPDPDAIRFPGQGIFALFRSLERELWLLAAVAMGLDVVLTLVGQHVGIAEANPVVRATLAAAGGIGFTLLKAAALGLALVVRTVLPGRIGFTLPLGLLMPTAFAVVVNTMTIAHTVG